MVMLSKSALCGSLLVIGILHCLALQTDKYVYSHIDPEEVEFRTHITGLLPPFEGELTKLTRVECAQVSGEYSTRPSKRTKREEEGL
jgi:hypothetical protein